MQNPFTLIARAGRGDLESQRQLADTMEALALQDGELVTVCEAVTMARMAAAHGHDEDEGRLLRLLALCGSRCTSPKDDLLHTTLQAEALARASLLADRGFGLAEELLLWLAEAITPEAAKMAHDYEAAISAACTEKD